MLESISSTQPLIHGSQTPQHSFINEKNKTTKLQDKDNNTLESESTKLSKKAFEQLSKEELAKVQQLKKRDLEVKAHELAHLSAAGTLAIGGASFSYTTGPDGLRYATGGEVSIDTSKVDGNPAATIRKADAIRRAALAPALPSSQDRLVANNATTMAETARIDLVQQTQEQKTSSEKTKETEEDAQTISESEIENDSNDIISNSTKGSLVNVSV